MALEILQIENHPVTSNCFVIYDKAVDNDCIIVDPGSEHNEELKACLDRQELKPAYIILTHEHFDHIWGCNELLKHYSPQLVCSRLCSESIQNPKRNFSVFYNQVGFSVKEADICLEDVNYSLTWKGREIKFWYAGGHSEAGICFTIEKYLFTGDTLIKDCKTVTKLYSGSLQKLKMSIEKLGMLKGKRYQVCPGHGKKFTLDTYDLRKAF